jgi:hypothetical protein
MTTDELHYRRNINKAAHDTALKEFDKAVETVDALEKEIISIDHALVELKRKRDETAATLDKAIEIRNDIGKLAMASAQMRLGIVPAKPVSVVRTAVEEALRPSAPQA